MNVKIADKIDNPYRQPGSYCFFHQPTFITVQNVMYWEDAFGNHLVPA